MRPEPGGAPTLGGAPWRLCRHTERRQQVYRLAHLDSERILNPDERARDLLDGGRIVPAPRIQLREMVQYGEGEPQWQDGGEDAHPLFESRVARVAHARQIVRDELHVLARAQLSRERCQRPRTPDLHRGIAQPKAAPLDELHPRARAYHMRRHGIAVAWTAWQGLPEAPVHLDMPAADGMQPRPRVPQRLILGSGIVGKASFPGGLRALPPTVGIRTARPGDGRAGGRQMMEREQQEQPVVGILGGEALVAERRAHR